MRFSYSRLKMFEQCPLAWKRKYIDEEEGEDNFFAQFGSCVHHVLERYAKHEISLFDLVPEYKKSFTKMVTADPPNDDMLKNYYETGIEYFYDIDLDLDLYDILGVEMEIQTDIGEYEFCGYIDLLIREKNTGGIVVLDHKSKALTFKKNGDLTKAGTAGLEEFKKQLYLYSKYVFEKYGEYPKELKWNLFRTGKILSIPFSIQEYEESISWAEDIISKLEKEEKWEAKKDYYYCSYLCEYRGDCDE